MDAGCYWKDRDPYTYNNWFHIRRGWIKVVKKADSEEEDEPEASAGDDAPPPKKTPKSLVAG